jgi:hypothetical protein
MGLKITMNEKKEPVRVTLIGRLPCAVGGELYQQVKNSTLLLETDPLKAGDQAGTFEAILKHRVEGQTLMGFVLMGFSRSLEIPFLPPIGTKICADYEGNVWGQSEEKEPLWWELKVEEIRVVVPNTIRQPGVAMNYGGNFELRGLIRIFNLPNFHTLAAVKEIDRQFIEVGWDAGLDGHAYDFEAAMK